MLHRLFHRRPVVAFCSSFVLTAFLLPAATAEAKPRGKDAETTRATDAGKTKAAKRARTAKAKRVRTAKHEPVLVAQNAPPPGQPPAAGQPPAGQPPAAAQPPAAPPPAAPPPAAPPPAGEPPAADQPPAAEQPPAGEQPAEAAVPAEPAAEATPPPEEPAPAPAPEAAPPADPAEMAAEGEEVPSDEPYFDEELQVVKVTVDRREKDLQEYAGAATAFQQEDMDRVGIQSVREMGAAQPYAAISNQEGNTEVYIRGVGSDNNTELGDPAVANHIDGIYIPRPKGVGSMLFDIERIEMNRGPQGTLRGRNATGGTINIITNKPELETWDAEASLQFGNFSQRVLKGMVNIPLGTKVGARVAAYGETHDPYFDNAGPVHTVKASESADNMAYRLSLRIMPIEELTIDIQQDYTQEKGTGWVGSNYGPALRAGILPEEIENPRGVVYRNPQGDVDLRNWGINGNVTADLGPLLIGYTGGYRNIHFEQYNGGAVGVDFPGQVLNDQNLDNWGTTIWDQVSESMVHELRLFAPDDARLRWTVGGFYFNEDQETAFISIADRTNSYLGTEYTMPIMKSHSWAGFADATFDIIEALRATAGIRFTTESKERKGIGGNWGMGGVADPVRLGTEGFAPAGRDRASDSLVNYTQPPFQTYRDGVEAWGSRDTLDEALAQDGVTLWDSMQVQDGDYSDEFLDWRAGLDADLSENNLVYGMFSTGHKSGGFNDQANQYNAQNEVVGTIARTYKPEVLYSTEVGSKNSFLDRQLIANVSAFWYSYKDQQFQMVVPLGPALADGTQPLSAMRQNAASSRYLGAELDLVAQLPADFTLSLSGLLLDARFTEGTIPDSRSSWSPTGDELQVDIEGNRVPRTSVLTLNYSLGERIPTPIGTFDWLISFQSKTQYYMTLFNGDGENPDGTVNTYLTDTVPGYTRMDLGIGFEPPDSFLRLDAFMNNVTDVAYVTSLINTPSLNLRYFNPPRTFGARLTVFYPKDK